MSAHFSESPGRWVTQQEAAQELGISTEAVRMRVRRGSIESLKEDDSRVLVWVVGNRSEDRTESAQAPGQRGDEPSPHLERLLHNQEREIEYLRSVIATRDEEIRRKDHLLAAALERIPELEAPHGERRGEVDHPPDAQPSQDRPQPPPAATEEGTGTRPRGRMERLRRWLQGG